MHSDPASGTQTAAAARQVLDRLRHACPDTGEDRTQVALDDALDALEARLRRLEEGGR